MLCKKAIFLGILLVLLLAIGGVCAVEDNNATDEAVSEEMADLKDNVSDEPVLKEASDSQDLLTDDDEDYVDPTEAYECLNEYRSQKGAWYWNKDDKTITYFNTNDDNQLPVLIQDAELEKTARIRAKELSELFDHWRPDGTYYWTAYPDDLIDDTECISWAANAQEATDSWKEDNWPYYAQGHRRNMLTTYYNCIGIAGYKCHGTIYWVQAYGKRNFEIEDNSTKNETPPDESTGRFAALNKLIKNNINIVLKKDYVYFNETDFKNGILISKSITIDGRGHTIDGAGTARIFNVTADNVILKNINFKGSFSSHGNGAIYSNCNNLTVLNCTFRSNFGYFGACISLNESSVSIINCSFADNYGIEGSIYCANSSPRIVNCTFTNNSAILYGPAVTSYASRVSISKSFFSNNIAYKGGAIYLIDCEGSIHESLINSNSAIYEGGAVYLRGGNVSFRKCDFIANFLSSDNFADGGALFLDSGIVNISKCSFSDNFINTIHYSASGGALYSKNGTVFITGSLFDGNHIYSESSATWGGALYLIDGNASMDNCEFRNNNASVWGGSAIYISNNKFSILNSDFERNSYAHALETIKSDGNVSNCRFTNNNVLHSGGISANEGNVTILKCEFTGNLAFIGGAIELNEMRCTIADCSFKDNYLDDYYPRGGAIFSDSSEVSVMRCNFTANSAFEGGSIYTDKTDIIIGGCIFTKNSASFGSAVYSNGGRARAEDCLFIENTYQATYNVATDNCTVIGASDEDEDDDVKITVKNLKATYGAGTYCTIIVTRNNEAASGVDVIVKLDFKRYKTLKTDSDGICRFKITQSPGSYDLEIVALGESVIKTLRVKHIIKLKKVVVKRSSKKLVLTASLAKVDGRYLKGKRITFKFNGKKYAAKTNKRGVAKVTVKSRALKKLKVGKKVACQATYGKDTVKMKFKIKR